MVLESPAWFPVINSISIYSMTLFESAVPLSRFTLSFFIVYALIRLKGVRGFRTSFGEDQHSHNMHNGWGKGEVTHRKGCDSEISVKLSEV